MEKLLTLTKFLPQQISQSYLLIIDLVIVFKAFNNILIIVKDQNQDNHYKLDSKKESQNRNHIFQAFKIKSFKKRA